jgi:hypothetical protein
MPPSISVATNAVILIVTSPEGLRTEEHPLAIQRIARRPVPYFIGRICIKHHAAATDFGAVMFDTALPEQLQLSGFRHAVQR